MARPIYTNLALVASAVNAVSLVQPGYANTPLYINGLSATGGKATFDSPRRVAIASGGNDSAITFAITGTLRPEQGGAIATDTISGGSGSTVYSNLDFATVTSVIPSGNVATTVTVGTNGVASTPWCAWSNFTRCNFQVSIQVITLSGTPGCQIEYTLDNIWNLPTGVAYPRPFITTDQYITNPVFATRVTTSAAPCSIQVVSMQQGF